MRQLLNFLFHSFLAGQGVSAVEESDDFLMLFSYSYIQVRESEDFFILFSHSSYQGRFYPSMFYPRKGQSVSLKASLSSHNLLSLLPSLPNADADTLPNADADADDDHGRCYI